MDEQVRRTEIAVVLGNLVLEDQVVAPRVPRELASQPVVLVQVVALMSEDQVRRELRLEAVEELLDRAALVRKERIAKIPDDDPRCAEAGREVGSALPRLLRTLAVAGQDDPQDLGLGISLRQPQDRRAAADLDVVWVGTDREHAQIALHRGR